MGMLPPFMMFTSHTHYHCPSRYGNRKEGVTSSVLCTMRERLAINDSPGY